LLVSNTSHSEHLRLELEALLGEDISSARRRERTTFDELTADRGNRLVLFGAGNLGRKTLRGLRKVGIEPLAFADNDTSLHGRTVDGLAVFAPQDAALRFGTTASFLVTIWRGEGSDTMAERIAPLRALGCETVLPFGSVFWKYSEYFLPHYSLDLPHKVLQHADEILRTFDLWHDEASRHEYVAQIRWRLKLDFDGLPRPVGHEIYFPLDLAALSEHEVFVDCGAFDGDTVRRFLINSAGKFARIVAFEADPENHRRLQEYVRSLAAEAQQRIKVLPFAVTDHSGTVRFSASGTESSFVGQGDMEVACSTLDREALASAPTWVKMDIEGSELGAIAGSAELIRRHSPLLAVCVYHQQPHLWQVPGMINELKDNYAFFLRPHLLESWDLLCYAIPPSRLPSGRTSKA
jgi:FkbM family methyltransferase